MKRIICVVLIVVFSFTAQSTYSTASSYSSFECMEDCDIEWFKCMMEVDLDSPFAGVDAWMCDVNLQRCFSRCDIVNEW